MTLADALKPLREKLAGAGTGAGAFYRANRLLVLGTVTALSIVLIVWARVGFTLDISRFYAAPPPAVLSVQCGTTQNVLTWTLVEGRNSNSILRSVDGATADWACGGPNNIPPCTNLNVNTFTDTNIQPGKTYRYTHKSAPASPSNAVTCPSATPTASPTPSGTPDPNDPGAGMLRVQCTGGATPRVTVRWSKSPPPGSSGPFNPGNPAVLNRTVGTSTQQLSPPSGVQDKGTYWEWMDGATPPVASGATATYRGKYSAGVGTNTVNFTASPENCGAATPTPTATATATPTPTKTATPTPPPGCFYQEVQCIQAPCEPVLVCPSVTPTPGDLVCAPASQTIPVGGEASLQAQGGGPYTWLAPGGTIVSADEDRGDRVKVAYQTAGTYTVSVRSSGRSASCTVVAASQQQPASDIGLSVTARNVSTGGPEGTTVGARGGQQVEVVARVSNPATDANLANVLVRASLPDGITYVNGTTTINNAPVTVDSVAAGGLAVGGMGPGQSATVRFKVRVNGGSFPVGTSQAILVVQASADGLEGRSGSVTISVSRPAAGGGAGGVQTGPGDAVLVALLVSGIVTLLYVSYTHSPVFRRSEVEQVSRDQGPMDFRS